MRRALQQSYRSGTAFCASIGVMAATLCLAAGAAPAPHETQFTVKHFVFDGTGEYVEPALGRSSKIASLFYGQTIENAISAGAEENAIPPAGSTSAKGEQLADPPRPPRSRFQVDRWTKENGLPANKVRSLYQCRDGYLWVGTVGGLARFDGLRFRVFDEENTMEMARNGSIARTIFEDDQGRLWFGTKRGMLCREQGRFVEFAGQEQLRGKMINGLAKRSQGGFWIAHEAGVSWRDESGVHELTADQVERPFCVLEQGPDTLWIGSRKGVFRLDLKNPAAAPEVLEGVLNGEPLQGTAVYGLFEDSRKQIWIGFGSGVVRIDNAGLPINATVGTRNGAWLPGNSRFTEDLAGRIWATAQVQEGIVFYQGSASAPEFVETPKVWDALCILADREGAVWAGTHEGLVRFREHLFTPMRLGIAGMEQSPVKTVTTSADGSLYFASRHLAGRWTGSGMHIFNFTQLAPEPGFVPALAIFLGQAWLSHPHGGLMKCPDFDSVSRTNATLQQVHREIGECRTLHGGRSGVLWIASEKGLFQMNNAARVIPLHTNLTSEVRVLLEDRDGVLWTGGEGGLECWEKGRLALRISPAALDASRVLSLFEGEGKVLWIGTDSGLSMLQDGILRRFGGESGMPQKPIHGIIEDDFGCLWLNHTAGVARVAVAELKEWLIAPHRLPAVRRFGLAEGLSNRETGTSPQSCARSPDGRLWFAKGSGLSVVDPKHCPPGVLPPPVFVEKALINGETYPLDSMLKIPWHQLQTLEFSFSAPSLYSPEKVVVQHRLEGYESDWRVSGALRRAIYGGLKPGAYRFAVRAKNHEGRWSKQNAEVTFQVVPPLWQTRPFRLAGGMSFAVALGGMGLWLTRRRGLLLREREAEITRERERLARDLHDHFAPRLAEITLAPRLEDATRAAAQISCAELPRLIWEVHPENDTLSSLLDFVSDYASRYLGVAGISLELDLPVERPTLPLRYDARREISALFKESLHNVVRHSRATQVMVAARWADKKFELRVSDNGMGFDVNRPANGCRAGVNGGHGLSNLHARCHKLGGRCLIDTAPGKGATVTFIVPVGGGI